MLQILIAFILSLGAVFFWAFFYFYYSPRFTTPRGTLFILFFGGIIAAVIAFFIEAEIFSFLPYGLNPFSFGQITIANPNEALIIIFLIFVIFVPTEEIIKFLILKSIADRKYREMDQIIDGLKFGLAVGLGFAFFENIIYFTVYMESLEKIDFLRLFFLRLFTSTLAHSLYSGFMGYFIALAKFNRFYSKKFIQRGILGAIVFHGLYNIFLFTSFSFLSIILLVLSLILIMRWYVDRRYLEITIQQGQAEAISLPFLASRPEFESILSKNKVSYNFIKSLNLCPFCLRKKIPKGDTCSYCSRKVVR